MVNKATKKISGQVSKTTFFSVLAGVALLIKNEHYSPLVDKIAGNVEVAAIMCFGKFAADSGKRKTKL